MKTSRRTLIGFGAGIAALVILTIILVLTLGQHKAPLLSEDTPAGAVQRYLLAVQARDYPAAFSYLAPQETALPVNGKTSFQTYDEWLMSTQNSGKSTWKATLGSVNITGSSASVEVMIDIFRTEGPLGNPISTNTLIFMLKNSGEKWLILSPADLYWLY
jgi:hypothetical protein